MFNKSSVEGKISYWNTLQYFPKDFIDSFKEKDHALSRLNDLYKIEETYIKDQERYLTIVNGVISEQINTLWKNSSIKICVDGGANRLYDYTKKKNTEQEFIPDYIVGDLDSLREDVKDFYNSSGTEIIRVREQDSTDLDKTFRLVDSIHKEKLKNKRSELVTTNGSIEVNVLGALGGNLSHTIGNINILYKWKDYKIALLSKHNSCFLLSPNVLHRIYACKDIHCSLIPIGTSELRLTTKGLKWDLNEGILKFGEMVSTSNMMIEDSIDVKLHNDYCAFLLDFRRELAEDI